jgi:hypothetical protein
MSLRILSRFSCVAVAGLLLAAPVRAEETGITPATALTPATPGVPVGPRVAFTQRETAVGDRAVQRTGMQLNVRTRIVQSGQIAHDSTSEIRSQQQRTVDVTGVTEGRATKARVAFQVARRQSPDSAKPTELSPVAIEGKSYLLERNGEELKITDAKGGIPPEDELKLVSEALAGVGKPNPLAVVLAGRELAVGQRIFVPRDLAKSLLNLGSADLAEVNRFELTLDRIVPAKDATTSDEFMTSRDVSMTSSDVAVFKVKIDVQPGEGGELGVTLSGEMGVEPVGCRLASVDLTGPVHVSTIERTQMGIFQYSMDGELKLAIRSEFGRVE